MVGEVRAGRVVGVSWAALEVVLVEAVVGGVVQVVVARDGGHGRECRWGRAARTFSRNSRRDVTSSCSS